MKINVNGEFISSDPDDHSVVKALNCLSENNGGFAILSTNDNAYIQTSGAPDEGFELEYQDGSLDRHFRCLSRNLSLSEVTNAFTSYLESDDKWRLEYSWELLDLSPGSFKKLFSRSSLDTDSGVRDRIRPPRLISIVWSMLLGAPFLFLGVVFAVGFVEALIEDPGGTIGGYIEGGIVSLVFFAALLLFFVIFPLILMMRALRNWQYRQSWNGGYSTSNASIKSKKIKRYGGNDREIIYEYWLTVQFHPSYSISSERMVTLSTQVEKHLFETVEEGESIPIRYARADPRIALLQGEL